MEVTKAETISQSAVSSYHKVHFSNTPDEMAELRNALKIVDNYVNKGMKSLHITEELADWTTYKFIPNQNEMTLIIKQGSCG